MKKSRKFLLKIEQWAPSMQFYPLQENCIPMMILSKSLRNCMSEEKEKDQYPQNLGLLIWFPLPEEANKLNSQVPWGKTEIEWEEKKEEEEERYTC